MKNIKFIQNLLTKGWKQIGELNGLPLFRHPKGTDAVLYSKQLIPKNSLTQFLENRAFIDKVNAQKKKAILQPKKIARYIQNDAKNRNLGFLDFGTENWFSYARGIKTPEENIKYYEQSFLPQIKETYNKLVNDGTLYFDPKTKKVMGVIEGKPVPLNNTEDKMAYIVVNTPNARHLQFDGDVYATGVPREYVSSFLKNGGANAAGKPTWGSSYLGSQSYYAGHGGISGVFTSIKPKLIKKLLNTGEKSKVPNKPILHTPTAINPTSHRFVGNNSINTVIAHEPFGYQITTKPIRDDVASAGLNTDVFTKMQIIGAELPVKAILGNSGRFSKTDKNPFNMLINPLLITGGLGGLTYASNKESN